MILFRAVAVLAACLMLGGSAFAGTSPGDPYAMPANVQAIMKKIHEGHAPTPSEQKAITDWSNGITGGHAAPAGSASNDQNQNSIISDDENDTRTDAQISADLCRKGGHAPGLGQRVSKDAYLTMARAMKLKYSANLDPDTASLIFQTLEKQHWSMIGGQFAAVLMARNSWSAAVVSAASGAANAPDDAMTANNLGSALKGLKDYGNAAIAFNYARTGAPDSAIVASNLGSLAVSYHDAGTAQKFYFAALSKAKDMSVPNAELGLQSLCGGKFSMAVKYFRASLKGGYTTLAGDGLYSTERYMQKTDENADIGEASDDSSGSSKGIQAPYLPQPPIADNVRIAIAWAGPKNPDYLWQKQWLGMMSSEGQEADALVKSSHPQASTSAKGTRVVYERGYEKELFLLSDLERVYARELGKAVNTEAADFRALTTQTHLYPLIDDNCAVSRPVAIKAYDAYVPLAHGDWPLWARYWTDKINAMAPVLGQIRDDSLRQQLLDRLFEGAYGASAGFAQEQGLAQGETLLEMQLGGKCGNMPPFDNVVKGAAPPKKLKTFPDACKIHESMNFGIASFKGDCDTMTLELNIELFSGSVNVNWGKDASQDQVTIFGGIGGSIGTGDGSQLSSVSGGAKIGDYVTFKGGEMVDGGVIASTSLNGQAGPGSANSETTIKYSTVSENDFGGMKDGVISGGTVFSQSNAFQISPPGLPDIE